MGAKERKGIILKYVTKGQTLVSQKGRKKSTGKGNQYIENECINLHGQN